MKLPLNGKDNHIRIAFICADKTSGRPAHMWDRLPTHFLYRAIGCTGVPEKLQCSVEKKKRVVVGRKNKKEKA